MHRTGPITSAATLRVALVEIMHLFWQLNCTSICFGIHYRFTQLRVSFVHYTLLHKMHCMAHCTQIAPCTHIRVHSNCTFHTNCTLHTTISAKCVLHCTAKCTLMARCTERHCALQVIRSTATPSSSPDAKTSAYKLPQIATNCTNGVGLL